MLDRAAVINRQKSYETHVISSTILLFALWEADRTASDDTSSEEAQRLIKARELLNAYESDLVELWSKLTADKKYAPATDESDLRWSTTLSLVIGQFISRQEIRADEFFAAVFRNPSQSVRRRLPESLVEPLKQIVAILWPVIESNPIERGDYIPLRYDSPTSNDMLGRKALAASLAGRIGRLLDEPGAEASLAIQLHAPWGGGKTSFMKLLQCELHYAAAQEWVFVDYNAWENQRIDAPWWLLYRRIFGSIKTKLGFPWGWLLNCRDLWWRFSFGNKLNLMIALLGIGAMIFVFWTIFDTSGIHREAVGLMTYFSPPSDKAGGIDEDAIIKFVAGITGLIAAGTGVIRALASGVLGGRKKASEAFLEFADDPMQSLRPHYLSLIKSAGQHVLVFVDDIDRCTPTRVVSLLEGIHTLFAHPKVAWIVAGDRRWIASAFEVSFDPRFGGNVDVVEPGNRFGFQFLEKLFQLTVTLPIITDELKERYWDALLGQSNPADGALTVRQPDPAEIKSAFGNVNSEAGILRILDQQRMSAPNEAAAYEQEAVRRLNSREMDANVEHFLGRFGPLLKPNPRAMKRLANSYMIFRDTAILSGDRLRSEQDRAELARWAILAMDAPQLLDWIESNPEAFRGEPNNRITVDTSALEFDGHGTGDNLAAAPLARPPPMELEASDLKKLWAKSRVQRLIYGCEVRGLTLGPLKRDAIDRFAPLRG